MPRKRQVRKARNVPEVPTGDEGKNLTKEEQQQKLQVFLADFDLKLEEKMQAIQHKVGLTMKRIDTYCQMGIQQIPKSLRKMTLGDFMAAGGTFESALESLAQKSDTNQIRMQPLIEIGQENSPLDNMYIDNQVVHKIASNSSGLEHISENQCPKTSKRCTLTENNSVCPSAMKKPLVHFEQMTDDDIDGMVTRTLRSTRQRKTLNKGLKVSMSTAKRGSRMCGTRPLETPTELRSYYRDFRTPAITPKFDPGLPMTPFDRSPKRGERLMSFAGSPVVIQTRRHKNIDKAQDKISTALIQSKLDTGAIAILNDVLELLKE